MTWCPSTSLFRLLVRDFCVPANPRPCWPDLYCPCSAMNQKYSGLKRSQRRLWERTSLSYFGVWQGKASVNERRRDRWGLWWTSLFLWRSLAEGLALTGVNRWSGALISVFIFHRRQFSVPRCNAHRAERQMGKRDEAHNTVATASRDRKGVFKWVSMRCTFLQPVQIPPWWGEGWRRLWIVGGRSNICTTRRRIRIWKPRWRGEHTFGPGEFHKHIFI